MTLTERQEKMIGTFGDLIFEGNARKVQMPRNIQVENKGRWSKAETQGKIPQSEFIGPDIQTVTFDITFSAGLGVNPDSQLKILKRMVEKGENHRLILNGRPFGKYPMAIKSASESWNVVTQKGAVYSATVSVVLETYR